MLRQRSRELEWLGTTDELTGLHNARYLQQHMHHLLGVQRRYGHPFALLLIDIDGLKRINDAYGQAAGDRTLVDVATALGEAIRAVDTPIRMTRRRVLRPPAAADRHPRAHAGGAASPRRSRPIEGPASQSLGVAVGVVSCPQHATEVEQMLEVADSAMYRAKAAGERVAVGDVPAPEPDGDGDGDGDGET